MKKYLGGKELKNHRRETANFLSSPAHPAQLTTQTQPRQLHAMTSDIIRDRKRERDGWCGLADRESENQSTALLSLSLSPMLAVFLKYNWKGLMTSPEVMKHVLNQTPTQMADKTVRPVPTRIFSRAEKPTVSQWQHLHYIAGRGKT